MKPYPPYICVCILELLWIFSPSLLDWIFFPQNKNTRVFALVFQLHIAIQIKLDFYWFSICGTRPIKNGILLPKLFWPTVRKNCSSDRENLLKFQAEGQEFEKFLRSLKGCYLIIFASNVFPNSHLIQNCIQNQQQLLILYTFLNQMRVGKNIRRKDDKAKLFLYFFLNVELLKILRGVFRIKYLLMCVCHLL